MKIQKLNKPCNSGNACTNSSCIFSHPRDKPCKFFLNGNCTTGIACPFSHNFTNPIQKASMAQAPSIPNNIHLPTLNKNLSDKNKGLSTFQLRAKAVEDLKNKQKETFSPEKNLTLKPSKSIGLKPIITINSNDNSSNNANSEIEILKKRNFPEKKQAAPSKETVIQPHLLDSINGQTHNNIQLPSNHNQTDAKLEAESIVLHIIQNIIEKHNYNLLGSIDSKGIINPQNQKEYLFKFSSELYGNKGINKGNYNELNNEFERPTKRKKINDEFQNLKYEIQLYSNPIQNQINFLKNLCLETRENNAKRDKNPELTINHDVENEKSKNIFTKINQNKQTENINNNFPQNIIEGNV